MCGTNLKISLIKQNLRYDPETGNLWWIQRRSGRQSGKPAGNNKGDYIQIHITSCEGRFLVYAHVAAYVLMTGVWPEHTIDHKDRNGLNNKWDNLRLATRSENSSNRGKRHSNHSGFKGVSKNGNKWVARVTKDYKTVYLGSYSSKEEAHQAYKDKARELFKDFYCDT